MNLQQDMAAAAMPEGSGMKVAMDAGGSMERVMEGLSLSSPEEGSPTAVGVESSRFLALCAWVADGVGRCRDRELETAELFSLAQRREEAHVDLPMVAALKEGVEGIADRVLFYCVCRDFLGSHGENETSLRAIVNAIHDDPGTSARVMGSFLDGSHALLAAGLLRLMGNGDSLRLSARAQELLRGEDGEAFPQAVRPWERERVRAIGPGPIRKVLVPFRQSSAWDVHRWAWRGHLRMLGIGRPFPCLEGLPTVHRPWRPCAGTPRRYRVKGRGRRGTRMCPWTRSRRVLGLAFTRRAGWPAELETQAMKERK